MTKNEVMKEFLKKTILPIVAALLLFSIFSRIFTENGSIDFFLVWLACGVPFWDWQDVHPDTDWLWYLRDSRRCCAEHRPQRSDRRRDIDLEARSGSVVSAADRI